MIFVLIHLFLTKIFLIIYFNIFEISEMCVYMWMATLRHYHFWLIYFILFIALLINAMRIYIMQKVTCNRARMKASWFLIKESGQALKHLKMSSEFASCSAIKIALVNSLNFRYCSVANSNICLLSVSSLKNI